MTAETITGIATIAAIIIGPILALEMQKRLDTRREARNRKLTVFKTLMTYRVTPLSPFFVQALNLIEVEFDRKSEKPVRDAWSVLLDHFADLAHFTQAGQPIPQNSAEKSVTLTSALLMEMGKSLGYDFNEVQIKKGAYYPMGLGNVEEEQHALRRALLDLLRGRGSRLPVAVFEDSFPAITVPPSEIKAEKRPAPEDRSVKKLAGG